MPDAVLHDPRWATSRATRSAATTTRCCGSAWRGWPHRIAAAVGPHRLSRVRRHRAGAREGAGTQRRPRLDRQAHQPDRPGRRLVVLPGRDLHRPAAAGGRAGDIALRHLHGLHRRLPDAGDRRAVPTRRAALHLLPDDRAGRPDPGRIPRRARQPHLRLRRLPAGVPVEQLRAGVTAEPDFKVRHGLDAPRPGRAVRLDARRNSCAARKAARSAASATSAGCATSPWRSAMRRTRRRCSPRCSPRADDPSPLVREHVQWALRRVRRRRQAYAAPDTQVVDQPRLAEARRRPGSPASRRRRRAGSVAPRCAPRSSPAGCPPARSPRALLLRSRRKSRRPPRAAAAPHRSARRSRRDRALGRRQVPVARTHREAIRRARSARRRSRPAGRGRRPCAGSPPAAGSPSRRTRRRPAARCRSSFATTVATPSKCPGRNAPQRMSARPARRHGAADAAGRVHLLDRRAETAGRSRTRRAAGCRRRACADSAEILARTELHRVDEDAGRSTRSAVRCAAAIRLTWPLCRLPIVGTNAMLSRASRQRVTISRSSAIRVMFASLAGPRASVQRQKQCSGAG